MKSGIITICTCLIAWSSVLPAFAENVTSDTNDDEIVFALLVERHGVRVPLENEERANVFNAQPWPAWPGAFGVLTPHGMKALRRMGDFERARYSVLLGEGCPAQRIYVEANSTQRTIASAHALLDGLMPRCKVPVVAREKGNNPLFNVADNAVVLHPDWAPLFDGKTAYNPDWFAAAFSRPLEQMHWVLTNCSGEWCKVDTPDFRLSMLKNGVLTKRIEWEDSSVSAAADFAENLLLEYTEGLPMKEVGWGRVSRDELNDLMEMNTRYHDLILRNPRYAQAAASDLAAHLRDTLQSVAQGRNLPGRLGTASSRMVLLVGHDANLSWLGGLLHLDWVLPDQTFNATPPGSALVFELHNNRKIHTKTVQVFFISPTLDQIRNLDSLQGSEKPSVVPVPVPGCSGPGPKYACDIEEFSRVVTSAIDQHFVQ